MSPPRRLSYRLRMSKVHFLAGWVVIAFALVVTGAFVKAPPLSITFKQLFGTDIRPQNSTIAAAPDETVISRLSGLDTAEGGRQPLLMTYHQVAMDAHDPYTITPQAFATQIDALARAGYRSLRAADIRAWMQGGALPPKSVLISFDDGNSGVWQYADPVLAQHGFTGVSFVITGQVSNGTSYMTWDELRELAKTGRWDIEAHTDDAHRYVPTTAHGDPQPALISRAWLSGQNRQEYLTEFQQRVSDDFAANTARLRDHGLPTPTLFAYPYSATNAADPVAAAWTTRLVKGRFVASMLDDDKGGLTTPAQLANEQLRRLDVLGTDSLTQLTEKIAASTALDPTDAIAQEASLASGWQATSGSGQFAPTGEGGTMTVGPRGWYETALAPSRSARWSDYVVGVRVRGLDRQGNTAAGVGFRIGSPGQTRVSVSAGWFTVKSGPDDRMLMEGKLDRASTHTIAVSAQGTRMKVTIDGRVIRTVTLPVLSAGGMSLFASSGRSGAAATIQDLTLTAPRGQLLPEVAAFGTSAKGGA